MDGLRTPPKENELLTRTYVGGEERNRRIDEILNSHRHDNQLITSSASIFPRIPKLNPELLTFIQYLRLKVILQEEQMIMDRSGEPRSAVMDRLNYYKSMILKFRDFEPIYLNFVMDMHAVSPDAARDFQNQAQNCTLSELCELMEFSNLNAQLLNNTLI